MKWKTKYYLFLVLLVVVINYILIQLMKNPPVPSEISQEKFNEIPIEIPIAFIPPSEMTNANWSEIALAKGNTTHPTMVVLVMACNRPSVKKCIDAIIGTRPSASQFPLIVSQDCVHEETENIIRSYSSVHYMKQPNQTDPVLEKKKAKLKGYFKISRHYKWALNVVFHKFKYDACIIVEDDLIVSPDFFEYFIATYPLLVSEKNNLYCVSAWNDNGKDATIDKSRPDLIHRTDFFPGLGWMITKQLWQELEPQWPEAFWDDWLRTPDIRKHRSCLRPEISRTETFGEKGVSNGMHFKTHLQHIHRYDGFFKFTTSDLSYLALDEYEETFLRNAYSSYLTTPEKLDELAKKSSASFRIVYGDRAQFQQLAKAFGIMADFKSGIPRTAYRGVVPFRKYNRWIYLCPIYDWKGYNSSWN